MHLIGIDASAKQASKLRNGHRVRVKQGEGFNLVVRPENYNLLTRAFRKGKGAEIQLSPDELELNKSLSPEMHQALAGSSDGSMVSMSGGGIFDSIKKIAKNPMVKSLGKMAIDQAVQMAPIPPMLKNTIASEAKKAAFGHGIMDTLKKASKNPLVKSLGKQAISAGTKYAAKSGYIPPAIAEAMGAEAQRQLAGHGIMDTLKKASKNPLVKSLGKQALKAGTAYAVKSGYVPPAIAEAVGAEAQRQLAGMGIMDTLKKAAKNPMVKTLGKQALKAGTAYAAKSGYIPPAIAEAVGAEAQRQLAGYGFMDTLKKASKNPLVKSLGKQALQAGTAYAAKSGYVSPAIANAIGAEAQKQLAGMGLYAGHGLYAGRGFSGMDSIALQTHGTYDANHDLAGYDRAFVEGILDQEPIKGYYDEALAPPSRGYGGRIRTMDGGKISKYNLIRGRGSLIAQDFHLPPALQSQPYGSNFHMQYMLPPQYQKYNSGTDDLGDYSVGSGLYA
jgi:hypothetical protein